MTEKQILIFKKLIYPTMDFLKNNEIGGIIRILTLIGLVIF
jgi:hypothetical protein